MKKAVYFVYMEPQFDPNKKNEESQTPEAVEVPQPPTPEEPPSKWTEEELKELYAKEEGDYQKGQW